MTATYRKGTSSWQDNESHSVLSGHWQPHHATISLTSNPLFPTQHPNSHQSIDHSPTESIKRPTRSQIVLIETVPVFRSPCILPTPPSPLHHFLAFLGHRCQ